MTAPSIGHTVCTYELPRLIMKIYLDHSDDFWPQGWMTYACIALGTFDLSLIAYLVHAVVRHGA